VNPRDRSRTASLRTPARRRGCRACLIALALLLSPATAAAQNPFTPLPSQPAQTVTTPPPVTTSSTSGIGNLSGTEQILLIGAGILLIAGIAFLIRRDARAKAPVTTRAAASAQRGTAQPRAKRVEQSRARAKAGRKQRKRARRR
jgi:hypothetical protein